MSLVQILVGASAGLLWCTIFRRRNRLYFLLACSVLAVFWFQPALAVRGLDFWLPVATLVFTALTWALTASPEIRNLRTNLTAGMLVAVTVALIGATRYLPLEPILTAGRPPPLTWTLIVLAAAVVATLLVGRFGRLAALALAAGLVSLIAIFVLLKNPALALWADISLRQITGQPPAHASLEDLRWLGFSYIAFRLMHTIRDRQSGRLPPVNLAEYITYVVFFPALTAGPIDRIERFVQDVRGPLPPLDTTLREGGWRLAVGLFKKFALADGLALASLSAANAAQVQHSGWAWVLLYAYALRIYFDFAGYTDIAIGLGLLLGVRLPENFNAPYLQANLTQFWNRWHMTLTQWFRAYVFNPLTRRLRSLAHPLPAGATVLVAQLATMLLIGMWHGVTWNFALWGAWHGFGLFVHNRWSEYVRRRGLVAPSSRARQAVLRVAGTLLSFNYVTLGWVFFALPTPTHSLRFLMILFGGGS